MRSFRLHKPEEPEHLREAVKGQMEPKAVEELIRLAASISRSRGQTNRMVGWGVVIVLAIVVTLLQSMPYYHPLILIAIGGVIVLELLDGKIMQKRTERIFAQLLIHKGIRPNICLKCDYDLRGSNSDACPECGKPIAPLSDKSPSP